MLKAVVAFGAAALATANAASAADSTALVVGPGPVKELVRDRDPTLALVIRPNRSAGWNTIRFTIRRNAAAVREAHVTLSFDMPAMEMGRQTFVLSEGASGVYTYVGPAIVMPGRWALTVRVVPRDGAPFSSLVVDRVDG
jgi:nitrogen fixation protein FixH